MSRSIRVSSNRSRPAPAWLAVLIAASLCGCGRATAPVVPPEAPAPAPNPGNALYACGRWLPAEPTVELAVFELNTIGDTAVESIRNAGGIVLHQYQVHLVRAVLPVHVVPDLYQSHQIGYAQEVDLDRPYVFKGVMYFTDLPTDDDVAFLESLGVTITFHESWSRLIAGTVPDEVVTAIQERPGLLGPEVDGYACVDGTASPASALSRAAKGSPE